MIRTALKPRWLGLLVLVALIVWAFVRLGLWQLDVAHDNGEKDALRHAQAQAAAPLHDVLRPHETFHGLMSNRKVTVTGTYDATGQFLVPDRVLDGQRGYWVVTPLDESAGGARVAVVRGFVPSPAQAGRPPRTSTTVTGTLAPGESPSSRSLPAGQRGSIDLAALVNQWPQDLYNAFVIAQAEKPDLAAGTALRRMPPPRPESQLNWRNFAYALQWWVFAAFAVYMWWRMVRDDHLADRQAALAAQGAPEPDGEADARPGASPADADRTQHRPDPDPGPDGRSTSEEDPTDDQPAAPRL